MAGKKPIRLPIGKTGYFLSSSARNRLAKIGCVHPDEIWGRMLLEREGIARMDTAVHPEDLPQMMRLYVGTNAKLAAQNMKNLSSVNGVPDSELARAVHKGYLNSSTFGPNYGEHYLKELRKMRIIAKPVKESK